MPVDGPRYYYLGPWVWEDTHEGIGPHWRAPEGTVGLVDLRGSSGGVGFFATGVELADPAYTLLGTSLSDPVDRGAWQDILPVTIEPGSILDALWDTLTLHADPDGVAMCPPLWPNSKGVINLFLGGHSLVRSRKWQGEADPSWPVVQAKLHNDYRKIREHALRTGSGDRTVHQRVLAVWQQKYRIQDEAKFIPRDLPVERARKPATTITDDFNRADASDWGANWTERGNAGLWSILSNEGRLRIPPSTSGDSRIFYNVHNTFLSSDDMYSQVDIREIAEANSWQCGVATRIHATNREAYVLHAYSTGTLKIYRAGTDGSGNELFSGNVWWNPSTIKIVADGPDILAYKNGDLVTSLTNSIVSGNLSAGCSGFWLSNHTWDTDYRLNNFEAADLAAGASVVPRIMLQHNHFAGGMAV